MKHNKKAYSKMINVLLKAPATRRQVINAYIETLGLTAEELADKSTKSRANIERSIAGAMLDDMVARGMVVKTADGVYSATDQRPVLIRNERCESEILKMLKKGPMQKSAIRSELIRIFGTDKTVTERDDSKLFAYMAEALRRMVNDGVLTEINKEYSLAVKTAARIDDINGMLNLKTAFLSQLHRRGGEFFETYFMNLLERYVSHYGKSVISNSTTGGSADGGIDGIMETVD